MAYIKATAIVTRVREIVDEGLGSARTLAASRFGPGAHEGTDDQHLSFAGRASAKPAEVAIVAVRPHPQRLAITGSVQIHLIDIEIRVVRTLDFEARIGDGVRAAIRALAVEDASVLTQALEWPPNLATTSGGESTDLQGVTYAGSRNPIVGLEGTAMRIDTVHHFVGTALSRPAAA